MSETVKVLLSEDEMPRQWYNIQADLKHPLPPPLKKDGSPVGPDDLAPVFPMNIIEQEVSRERWIDIPEPVLEKLSIWRPSPLCRAVNLEKALSTPAKILQERAIFPRRQPQGQYRRGPGLLQQGVRHQAHHHGNWRRPVGQRSPWPARCSAWNARYTWWARFHQKPFRKMLMRVWGADCVPSPSRDTPQSGRAIWNKMTDTPGSLAIAISEAIEDAVTSKNTRYSLGSVLNHVLLHQSIIGLEAQKQFKKIGLYPDVVIGCVGGGSNFAGISFPFICDKIHGRDLRVVAVEPTACPTLTRGPFVYDAGDVAMMTPLLAMHSLGHGFVPAPIHAGGLRYHGMAPLVSHVVREGLAEACAIQQLECYEAAMLWSRTEGYIPAPETSHAIAAAIREAKKAREEGRERVILLNWSGHGLMDLTGYEAYLNGKLSNYTLPDADLQKSLRELEGLPKPPPL